MKKRMQEHSIANIGTPPATPTANREGRERNRGKRLNLWKEIVAYQKMITSKGMTKADSKG